MLATAYRYLAKLPGVRRENTIVESTRIGVHEGTGLTVNGAGADDVVLSFPALTRAQVYEYLAYDEDHRAEMDALFARHLGFPSRLEDVSSALVRDTTLHSLIV